MAYEFQNGKAIYTPFNYHRLGLDADTPYERYITGYATPVQVVDSKTQISVRDDCVQVRLALANAPKSGEIMYVADKFKPESPVIFTVYRDISPFQPVGMATLGTDGKLQIFQSAAGNVQIFGTYMVKEHE